MAAAIDRAMRARRGAPAGARAKKGLACSSGWVSAWGALAEIREGESGESREIPGPADGAAAEVSHVGVERLGAGDGENHGSEEGGGVARMPHQQSQAVKRIQRAQDRRFLHEVPGAEQTDHGEPHHHDRAE